MSINACCRIVAHTDAGPGYRWLKLAAPQLAEMLEPGQFVHIKIPTLEASALRRPFSVFDADAGCVTVLYKKVGRGTEALAKVACGEEVEVLGPLGHGFPVACQGRALLVGGGYGVAPLHFLAKRLVRAGQKPVLFVGGRTRDDLLALEAFAELGVEVCTATNDGSAGVKGFVTVPLDETLEALKRDGEPFALYTCGPDGLLKAVATRAVESSRPGWISMDRHMICAVGACFACIQKIRGGNGETVNARCCVDGPVFPADILVWD